MKNNITGTATEEIKVPIAKVWHALTTPEVIKQYFFDTDTISDFKQGSPILFRGTWKGQSYQDKGTILEVNAPRKFRYNYWSSMSGIEDKPEHYVVITYALEEMGAHTRLTITQENIPDEQMRVHSEQNWRKVLDGLKQLLEQGTAAKG